MEKVLDGEILLPGERPPREETVQDVARRLSEEIRSRQEMMLQAAIMGRLHRTVER